MSQFINEKPVQPLSIQWLDLKKIFEDNPNSTEQLADAIEKIVKRHNETINSRKTDDDEDDGYVRSHEDSASIKGYAMVTYRYRKEVLSDLEQQTQLNPKKTKTNHFLIFFYQEQEPRRCVIALSSSHAWLVVRRYADHSFPVKVAERVANPRKMIQLARRCLFGVATREDLLHPGMHELFKTSNLYYFIENFKCDLKQDSSLFHLIKSIDKTDRCWIKVTTGGILRVGKRIAIKNFPIIFDLFTKYMRGVPTKDTNNLDEVGDPLFEFLHFLQPASRRKQELDGLFINDIFTQWNETKEPLVDFRHKNLEDFLFGTLFEIKIGALPFEPIGSEPPEMKKIIEKIGAEDLHAFEERMRRGKIKFLDPNSKEQIETLIDCVEGQMQVEGESHFKIKKMWYVLAADHLALLCHDFKTMVRNHLIAKDDEEQLPLSWKGSAGKKSTKIIKEAEQMYNRSYLREDLEEFMVFDQILPIQIEPCDILRWYKDRVYLYHVKEKFGNSTRDACSQILNAATLFRSALSLDSQPSNYLEKLWDLATKGHPEPGHWRNDVKRQVEPHGKDNFINIFRRHKLVFVYAYLPDKEESYFQNLLMKFEKPIKENFRIKLIQSGFWDPHHQRLTGKFYSITDKDFKLEGETDRTCKEIYKQLDAGRFSKSTIAKFELVRLAQNLHALNFEFKICEITRAELDIAEPKIESEEPMICD